MCALIPFSTNILRVCRADVISSASVGSLAGRLAGCTMGSLVGGVVGGYVAVYVGLCRAVSCDSVITWYLCLNLVQFYTRNGESCRVVCCVGVVMLSQAYAAIINTTSTLHST